MKSALTIALDAALFTDGGGAEPQTFPLDMPSLPVTAADKAAAYRATDVVKAVEGVTFHPELETGCVAREHSGVHVRSYTYNGLKEHPQRCMHTQVKRLLSAATAVAYREQLGSMLQLPEHITRPAPGLLVKP